MRLTNLALILGTAFSFNSVAGINTAYLQNNESDTLRLQVTGVSDKVTVYNETNVNKLSSQDSYTTNRVIGGYSVYKGLKLNVIGTYAPRFKTTVYGIGYNYKTYGLIVGVDDNLDTKGLVYWGYKNDKYRLSTNGYVDLQEEPRGRFDIMFNLDSIKFGYEYQYPDETNWLKFEVKL